MRSTDIQETGIEHARHLPEVVVVGGGVSGCSCAASLAGLGLKVTVVSDALDSVGLPAFGPDVSAGKDRGEIAEVLGAIPVPLRDVWVSAAVTSVSETGFFSVDRRMISIETKRVLEEIALLEFRQGLVTDLKTVEERDRAVQERGGKAFCVAVETGFGEVIEADAVVLAVGLGIGGRVYVGADVLRGRRHREGSVTDGLRMALEKLGATFAEVTVEVGSRFGGSGVADLDDWVRGGVGTGVSAAVVGVVPLSRMVGGGEGSGCAWPAEYPEAPHWSVGLRAETMGVVGLEEGEPEPWISPDGAATGEFHVSPAVAVGAGRARVSGSRCSKEGRGVIASRLAERVNGLRILSVSSSGRLGAGDGVSFPVWAAGRFGGAGDYVESLRSGVRVAEDVATVLREICR